MRAVMINYNNDNNNNDDHDGDDDNDTDHDNSDVKRKRKIKTDSELIDLPFERNLHRLMVKVHTKMQIWPVTTFDLWLERT